MDYNYIILLLFLGGLLGWWGLIFTIHIIFKCRIKEIEMIKEIQKELKIVKEEIKELK